MTRRPRSGTLLCHPQNQSRFQVTPYPLAHVVYSGSISRDRRVGLQDYLEQLPLFKFRSGPRGIVLNPLTPGPGAFKLLSQEAPYLRLDRSRDYV